MACIPRPSAYEWTREFRINTVIKATIASDFKFTSSYNIVFSWTHAGGHITTLVLRRVKNKSMQGQSSKFCVGIGNQQTHSQGNRHFRTNCAANRGCDGQHSSCTSPSPPLSPPLLLLLLLLLLLHGTDARSSNSST